MSYSNFGKQHDGRGLKAFVIVVCVLLVVAIVASALVLWRTTNHYTELPEFNDEDGEDFILTDDEEFNEDPFSDDDPDLSGNPKIGVEYESMLGSTLSFEVETLSSDVSAYATPLSTASVKVTADFDLSKVNWEWYFEADEEDFYYDGCWHDVMGEVFDDDYGNNISSYLTITSETCDSCTVQFWDYFPATTYLYYRCWNSTGEAVGRVLVDCSVSIDDYSFFLFVGDLVPSYQCSDFSSFLFGVSTPVYGLYYYSARFNSAFFYDGLNCYNTLFYGDVSFLLDFNFNSSNCSPVSKNSFSVMSDLPIFAFCTTSDGGLVGSTLDESSCSISSLAFSGLFPFDTDLDFFVNPSLFDYDYASSCGVSLDALYYSLLPCIFNQLGAVLIPKVVSYRSGSYVSDYDSVLLSRSYIPLVNDNDFISSLKLSFFDSSVSSSFVSSTVSGSFCRMVDSVSFPSVDFNNLDLYFSDTNISSFQELSEAIASFSSSFFVDLYSWSDFMRSVLPSGSLSFLINSSQNFSFQFSISVSCVDDLLMGY